MVGVVSVIFHERFVSLGRPIGAVVFMQRGLLKICLSTTANSTNTAEVAKVRVSLIVSVNQHGFSLLVV